MRRLSIREVAPFFCFEPDSVNFSDESLFQDNLDIFVPNPSFPDAMEMEDEIERKVLEHDEDKAVGLRAAAIGAGLIAAASHTSSSSSSSQDAPPPVAAASFPTLMGASAISATASAGIMTSLEYLYYNRNNRKYHCFLLFPVLMLFLPLYCRAGLSIKS
jgi:hypothetical protein